MIRDDNPFYILAKKFDEEGCIAYKCKNMNEARNIPNTLEALRGKDVQIVILDNPKYIQSMRRINILMTSENL